MLSAPRNSVTNVCFVFSSEFHLMAVLVPAVSMHSPLPVMTSLFDKTVFALRGATLFMGQTAFGFEY